MKRYAAIDVGTNSIRLLVWKEENNKIFREKFINTTRIGQAVDKTGKLSIDGMQRSVKAICEFVEIAKKYEINKIPIIATSAVRDSKNSHIFCKEVLKQCGQNVEIIDGKEEAKLGYEGVLMAFDSVKSMLIIDIGGGSTELIYGDNNGINILESLNIGAVRLTEKFIKNELVTNEEEKELINYIDKIKKSVMDKIKKEKIDKVIGIGGTATTLVSMNEKLEVYDPDKVHNSQIKLNEIEDIIKTLKSMKLEERKNIPGLHPKRADIIYAGAIILREILKGLNKDYMIASEYDNLEGIVYNQKKAKQ